METETRVKAVTEAILYGKERESRWKLQHGNGYTFTTKAQYTKQGIDKFIERTRSQPWIAVCRVD